MMLYEIEWMDDASGMRDDLPEYYGTTIVEAPEPFKAPGQEFFRLPQGLVAHAVGIASDWARAYKCDFEVRISGYTPARFGENGCEGTAHAWHYMTLIERHGRRYDPDRIENLCFI